MKLSSRQQRALQSICDTFAPPENGWPSASELGIPAAIRGHRPSQRIRSGGPDRPLELAAGVAVCNIFTQHLTGSAWGFPHGLPKHIRINQIRVLQAWSCTCTLIVPTEPKPALTGQISRGFGRDETNKRLTAKPQHEGLQRR